MNVMYPLSIYYDASCPLCAREMHTLKSFDAKARLELIDCSAQDFSDAYSQQQQIPVSELMRLIHARDADGRWYRGVDVFVLAYGAVGISAMAKLWAHPWLRPVWDRLYPWVANNRMWLSALRLSRPFGWLVAWLARRAQRRAMACKDGLCSLPAAGNDKTG